MRGNAAVAGVFDRRQRVAERQAERLDHFEEEPGGRQGGELVLGDEPGGPRTRGAQAKSDRVAEGGGAGWSTRG